MKKKSYKEYILKCLDILERDRFILGVGYCLLLITILPLIVASFYNHIYADDFSYGRNAMHILDKNMEGFETAGALFGNAIATMISEWKTWSGCYTSFFFSSLAPGAFGEEYVFLNIFILLGSFLLANYFSFRIILVDVLKLDDKKSMIIVCFLLFLSIQFVPSIPEAFYWFNGAFYNIVGYSFGLLQLAFVLKLMFGDIKKGVHLIGVGAVALAILFAGTNYSFMLLCMVYYVVIIAFYIVQKKHYRLQNIYAMVSIVVFFVFSFLNIMAPGNAARQQEVGEINSAIGAIYQAIVSVGPFIRENINLLQILIILVSLPIVYECAQKMKFSFKYPLLVSISSYLSLAISFTPTCYALRDLGPNRTLNLYYFILIELIYVNLFYVCGWISHNKKRVVKECSLFNYVKYGVYIVLVIMILIPRDDMMSMTSVITTKEILNGDLEEYDEQVTARHVLYNNPQIKVVELEPLTVNPKCFTVNLDENISTDPEWWVNRSICMTYDKDLVYIKSK